MSAPKQLHLNAFLMNNGHHEAAWRHPLAQLEKAGTLEHFVNLAKIAERGKLDSIFLADGLAINANIKYNSQGRFEPLTLLSAIAAVTEHIGLIATVSTTYNEPFHVARKFASLDHLSKGRAGWNIVTSARDDEANNFNRDTNLDHRERYARATEFLEVAIRLWDSWEDDAVVRDKTTGVYADTEKIHALEHRGDHFSVRGPLNVPRPVQGRPLLVQAGSSNDGKDFAARYAEAVFTAQQTLDEGKAFYADLKSRIAAFGRDADSVKILPGIAAIVGSTEEEAKRREQELNDLLNPEYGLRQLSSMLEHDLTGIDLDGPLPDIKGEDDINGGKSRFTLVTELAKRENLTVRQLLARLAGGRGHRTFAGTPEQIADSLESWFRNGAADGFNVMPPLLPGGLEDFVDHVVPVLQRRGLFRTEYTGESLRDNYGLPRPANAFTATGAREDALV
jgi:FMN-dependent oxidoreductase (nitrilotriacetate monooxygenase family)